MKTLFFAIALMLSINIYAQREPEKINKFIRVYDLAGIKINKGKLLAVTDTSLQLKGGKGLVTIYVRSIGTIKTKRSFGHNILIVSAIVGPLLYFFGINSMDASVGEAIGPAIFGGLSAGVTIGGLISLSQQPKTYYIYGNVLNWNAYKEKIAR